jgi:hypothetical protein
MPIAGAIKASPVKAGRAAGSREASPRNWVDVQKSQLAEPVSDHPKGSDYPKASCIFA